MSAQLTRLNNGLRVVTEDMPGLETTSLGVWVDVGARSEPEALNGISHMLEHMAFKGTTTRSAREIVEQIESVGGQLNAYTSREQTAYFARVLADDVPLAVDIPADCNRSNTRSSGVSKASPISCKITPRSRSTSPGRKVELIRMSARISTASGTSSARFNLFDNFPGAPRRCTLERHMLKHM